MSETAVVETPVNAVTQAFELAKKKFDSMAIVCGILDVSNSYAYQCIKTGEMSLPSALKMELMLDYKYTWRDLCPRMRDEVDSIKDRL